MTDDNVENTNNKPERTAASLTTLAELAQEIRALLPECGYQLFPVIKLIREYRELAQPKQQQQLQNEKDEKQENDEKREKDEKQEKEKQKQELRFDELERALRRFDTEGNEGDDKKQQENGGEREQDKNCRLFLFAENPSKSTRFSEARGERIKNGARYLLGMSTKATRELALADFEPGCADPENNLARLAEADFKVVVPPAEPTPEEVEKMEWFTCKDLLTKAHGGGVIHLKQLRFLQLCRRILETDTEARQQWLSNKDIPELSATDENRGTLEYLLRSDFF
jgi:hypothetical protein